MRVLVFGYEQSFEKPAGLKISLHVANEEGVDFPFRHHPRKKHWVGTVIVEVVEPNPLPEFFGD